MLKAIFDRTTTNPLREAVWGTLPAMRDIAALSFFYLSNSATLSVIFGRDLLKKQARDERLDHMVCLVLAALTGKSATAFAKNKAPKPGPAARSSVR